MPYRDEQRRAALASHAQEARPRGELLDNDFPLLTETGAPIPVGPQQSKRTRDQTGAQLIGFLTIGRFTT